MIGPPGSGKSMIAKRIPSILPPISLEEAIETTKIHSICGQLNDDRQFITARPFRSPHHTISLMPVSSAEQCIRRPEKLAWENANQACANGFGFDDC
ncbi:MAG TPA: ATP-binding protein [Chthoniobacterales bacterium]|nr:ATP-binding protein [Chthoniobacterales bacterium]